MNVLENWASKSESVECVLARALINAESVLWNGELNAIINESPECVIVKNDVGNEDIAASDKAVNPSMFHSTGMPMYRSIYLLISKWAIGY